MLGYPLPPGSRHRTYGQQAGGMHPTGMQSCLGNATKEAFVLYSANVIICDLGEYTSETCDAGAGEDENDNNVGDNGGDDHDDNGGSNDEGSNGGTCTCITSCENRNNGDYQVIQKLKIGTLVIRHREKLFSKLYHLC